MMRVCLRQFNPPRGSYKFFVMRGQLVLLLVQRSNINVTTELSTAGKTCTRICVGQ